MPAVAPPSSSVGTVAPTVSRSVVEEEEDDEEDLSIPSIYRTPAPPRNDEDRKVMQMTGMGFNDEESRAALMATNGDVAAAVDHVMTATTTITTAAPAAAPAESSADVELAAKLAEIAEMGFEAKDTSKAKAALEEAGGEVKGAVRLLLAQERASRAQFEATLRELADMGFEGAVAKDCLQIAKGDMKEAVKLLVAKERAGI